MRSRYLLILLMFSVWGCSSNQDADGTANDGAKKYRIAVIPKGTSHDFWKSVHFGAEKAAKELGNVEISWQGTADETDKEGQIKIVDTFVGRKVDGIVLAPIDRDAFVPVVKRAKQRDIPVVVFDSGLRDLTNVVSYVATDNSKGGHLAGEKMIELMDGKGGVILLRYQAGSESTEQREEGFLEEIEAADGVKVLSESQRVNSSAEEALKIAEQLLRNHKDNVTGVFTVCEPNNKGMLQALENLQMAGDVKFIAFDSDPRIVEGLKDGSVDGVILQDPVNMGYLAVKTMVAKLEGEEVEKRIDTGVYLVTPENMNEEKYQKLLDPDQFEAK
ncbi:ABC transporter substrate-binding protein [Thalassoroseus pseudoceratinae]|uniref:ABC transporter substrate-binding protein n=1 Tax=Thalassoroseus pseudoceratinae TaxID=2713176 RepID=UPI00142382C3|nr:substrate-binding domain-containing protein [Thalassoroseus pseudoceratinae]